MEDMYKILIIDGSSGIQFFGDGDLNLNGYDNELISSFFQAFVYRFQNSCEEIKKINTNKKTYNFYLIDEILVIGIFDSQSENDYSSVPEKLEKIGKEFIKKYGKEIEDYNGDITKFNGFEKVIKKIIKKNKPPEEELESGLNIVEELLYC